MGRPKGQTAAGAATQARLFETAIALFAERGYGATTLRAIAGEAGVSAGLLYKHFPSKAAVVLRLYDQLSLELSQRPLPPGVWRVRFMAALRSSLAVLEPHRGALRALIPVLLGDAEQGLFSEQTRFSRTRVQGLFTQAVSGARTPPPVAIQAPLGRVLYMAHLGVVLAWLLDRSAAQQATKEAVVLVERALPALALALRLPGATRVVERLDGVIREAFFEDPA
jgi:AcrR family transcriptional regulator